MISVTRLNGSSLFVNALLIETIEATPDTIITLTNGKKYLVKEPVAELIQSIQEFYREIDVIKPFSQSGPGGSHVAE